MLISFLAKEIILYFLRGKAFNLALQVLLIVHALAKKALYIIDTLADSTFVI